MIVIFDETHAAAPDPNRDPRIDPKPGDVLKKGGFTRTVEQVKLREVWYRRRREGAVDESRGACWITTWRDWAKGANRD